MILINIDQQEFEYDIHSLVKAFYPEEDVVVLYPGKKKPEEAPVREMFLEIPKESPDRKTNKDKLKQDLYKRLVAETGKELPWGSLTGIRPVKIAMKMLTEGRGDDEIRSHMRGTYFCSEEKISLSLEIAKRENDLIAQMSTEKGYSLYVGIPFCPTTCLYCSFASYPITAFSDRVDEYLNALDEEIASMAEVFRDRRVNSVYLGGGTPTSLSPQQLSRIIHKIKYSFNLSDCKEFTVEAGRPDSITEEKLAVLKENRVSRISVNPQTFSQKTLDLIGRYHTTEQTIESYQLARAMGFDNINMDLIIGLPGEDASDITHTMEVVKSLRPDDVTIHSLAVKRASRLKLQMEEYRKYQMKNTMEYMKITEDSCRSMGLTPYYLYRQKNMAGNFENVGYASPGKAGIYNVLMMEEVQDIVACGAGTVSKRVFPDGRIERCDTVKDLDQYIERIDEMVERKRKLFGTEG